MFKKLNLLLIVLFILSPKIIFSQSEEEIIIKTVQQFFDGMSAADTVLSSKVLLHEGQFFSIRGDSTNIKIGRTLHETYIKGLTESKVQYKEVMHDPKVFIHNRIAIVWTNYEFYRDGKRSHGGVDAFSLIKTTDGWKIAGTIYTVE